MRFALPAFGLFDDLPRDLRLAMRLLVKDRWFTAAATFALSLGIAANTTVYTVVNTMMLRGLPVAHPDRFVAFDDPTHSPLAVSYRDVEDWRASATRFAGLVAYAQTAMTVDDAGRAPEQFGGAYVGGNAFQLLEEQPLIGRDHQRVASASMRPPLTRSHSDSRRAASASRLARACRKFCGCSCAAPSPSWPRP